MDENTNAHLNRLGIKQLTEMQLKAGEVISNHQDLVLLSPTGSGKTLAFMLPLISNIKQDNTNAQLLILAPSRELAIQLEQVFKSLRTNLKVNCCYGGHSTQIELNNFNGFPQVVIGTPGRIADHLRRGSFNPGGMHTLVLDEFDKSLELGFEKEMTEILGRLVGLKQRILTSATSLAQIPDFVGLSNPIQISYLEKQNHPPQLELKQVIANGVDKLDALFRLLCYIGNEPVIVFVNHREAAERISEHLKSLNVEHDLFHGGLQQLDRERALLKFRNGSHQLLVATDLASRGIDIPEIKCVIHYQLPGTQEAFVHRNGRTARMNATGVSYCVLAENEHLPDYISSHIPIESCHGENSIPDFPEWITMYLPLGRKDNVNKVDVVGFVLKNSPLSKENLGKVDVLDRITFFAVRRGFEQMLIKALKGCKIKGRKVQLQVSL